MIIFRSSTQTPSPDLRISGSNVSNSKHEAHKTYESGGVHYSVIPAQKFSLFHYSFSKIFVIPLFLLKNFHYSIIPPKKAHIIPLIQEQKFRYSYSIIPLHPPNTRRVNRENGSKLTSYLFRV